MDATKWKSVVIPIRSYELLKRMAKAEQRTISGQLRYLFESWKHDYLSKNDQTWIADELKKMRANDPTHVPEEPSFSLPDD